MDCYYQELVNHHPNANQPTLPIEILELIVDDLASDTQSPRSSLKALHALALVSIALCRRAYKHLFSELSLILADNISDDHELCVSKLNQVISRLHNLLFQGLQFPGIGMVYYIRTVQISIVFSKNVQILQNVFALPEMSGILDCLHSAYHGITCLRLDIDLTTHSTHRIKFPIHISKRANPGFFNAFISLCRSPRFTTLHLTNVALESKSLCGTNVQNLHLNNLSIDDSKDVVHHSTGHPHKAILQPISLSLLNIDSPKPNTVVPTDIFTDLASFLHPTPDVDQALARTHVFNKLAHLTLQDRDQTTPIHLLPRLNTLKILQTIYLTRRHMSYTTALPQFFLPFPEAGTTRDLGSVENLIVETLIPDSRLFFCPEDEDEPRLEDAWGAVDAHLANALVGITTSMSTSTSSSGLGGLRHVHFTFFLRTNQVYGYVPYRTNRLSSIPGTGGDTGSNGSGTGAASLSESTIESLLMFKFMADKDKFTAKFFPRLSSSEMAHAFSSDASSQREDPFKDGVSGVKCKGDEMGWW